MQDEDEDESHLKPTNGWLVIPIEVSINPYLTHTEKLLFCQIWNLTKQYPERGCWASNQYLADQLFTGKQTISNGIANLEIFKLVKIKEVPIRNSLITERRVFIDNNYMNFYEGLLIKYTNNIHKINQNTLLEILYDHIKNILGGNNKFYNRYIKGNNLIESSKNGSKEPLPCSTNKEDEVQFDDCSARIPSVIETIIASDPIFDCTLGEHYDEVEAIILHWNQFKKPAKHPWKRITVEGSITFEKTIGHILRELNRIKQPYSAEEIKQAISLYYGLLTSEEYFVPIGQRAVTVGTEEFFKFNGSAIKLTNTHFVKKHKVSSWFDECCQGKKYLLEKYGRKQANIPEWKKAVEDKHPAVTKKLTELWEDKINEHSPIPVLLNNQDINNIIKASNLFVEFMDNDDDDIDWDRMGRYRGSDELYVNNIDHLLKAIEYAIESNANMTLTSGWLCSPNMFAQRLPDYLEVRGMTGFKPGPMASNRQEEDRFSPGRGESRPGAGSDFD